MTWYAEAAKTRYYSQAGEDGVIEEVFRRLGIETGWFLECGAGNGRHLSNTRRLAERQWDGFWIEADKELCVQAMASAEHVGLSVMVIERAVEAGTLDRILDPYILCPGIDLLSLDIDGNDYWVWKSLKRQPKLVVIEYNAGFPPETRKTIKYDPEFRFGNTDYHGATAGALYDLGKAKGYKLIATVGVNLFFLRNDLADGFDEVRLEDVPWRRSWRKDPEREMIEV